MDIRQISIHPCVDGFDAVLVARWGQGRAARAKPVGRVHVPYGEEGPQVSPDSLRALAAVLDLPWDERPRCP